MITKSHMLRRNCPKVIKLIKIFQVDSLEEYHTFFLIISHLTREKFLVGKDINNNVYVSYIILSEKYKSHKISLDKTNFN